MRKYKDFLKDLKRGHDSFYKIEQEQGPAFYFHKKSLESSSEIENFSEASYAMLVAWGMHRPGKHGPKLKPFNEYKSSLKKIWNDVEKIKTLDINSVTERDWTIIGNIFKELNIVKGSTVLVANSKLISHLMPKLIPPVDRSNTLKYLKLSSVEKTLDGQWKQLENIIKEFYIPASKDQLFLEKNKVWSRFKPKYFWDTSKFKVIDNIIMGIQRDKNSIERATRKKNKKHLKERSATT
jgi:hypothetical protein